MTTFCLIHGAWHGAWCWQRVTPSAREGLRDRAIPRELRRLMVAAIPHRVTSMDTDH